MTLQGERREAQQSAEIHVLISLTDMDSLVCVPK